jgi:tripartite-type tricarboxylate transporter receptor subunit TctC
MLGAFCGTAKIALASVCITAIAGSAVAQDYPSRPVKIVVGFTAGGGVDTSARVVGEALSRGLGQPVIVENKPGAAGTIGATEVARSNPDGYTLLVTPGGHSIYGAIFKSLPFETVKSFDWISSIVSAPFIVLVPANSEFKTLSDLIAKAKSAPGAINFGSAGQGTTHHLALELLAQRSGTKLQHVPYRGDAPLNTALLAGEVQLGLATPTLAIGNIESGKLRALAVTSNERLDRLPDVPTVEQALGIKDYDVRTWFGLAAPAGLPQAVREKLNAELRKSLSDPEVRKRLSSIGDAAPTSPEQMRDRVARELQTWTTIVNDAGIAKQ